MSVLEKVETYSATGLSKICPGHFTRGICSNGHEFIKLIYCGKEWCPICGEVGSVVHNRRIARWIPKAQKMAKIGYFVFTVPKELRSNFQKKEALDYYMKRVATGYKKGKEYIPGFLEAFGFKRGMCRWHFFGDKSGEFNPHLNVLVDHKWLTPKMDKAIKRAWAGLIGYNQPDKIDVNYSYNTEVPGMYHDIAYVTRATFHDYNLFPYLAKELIRFRNMRVWGWGREWKQEPDYWKLEQGTGDIAMTVKIENSVCPLCDQHISWNKAQNIAYIEYYESRVYKLVDGSYMVT